MAIEFNITAAHKFFLGEDKVIRLKIFQEDGVTPLDVAGIPLEWNMRKTDRSAEAVLTKGLGSGLAVVGTYNANPNLNTQVVEITFVPLDTIPADTLGLKADYEYRHSLKRKDTNNNNILTYGGILFLQATER